MLNHLNKVRNRVDKLHFLLLSYAVLMTSGALNDYHSLTSLPKYISI